MGAVLTEWFAWTDLEYILAGVLAGLVALQAFFYLRYFMGMSRFGGRVAAGKVETTHQQPPVSVIITTRDQHDILARQLPLILEQDYPEFEVVVVNDASSDDTEDLLKQLSDRYSRLYHTFVPPGVQNISTKKMALTVGIKAAKYDHLLFTEANCLPSGNRWIASMMRQFVPGISVVLGYSRYERLKGILRLLVGYDNLFQAMRFLGMAASGKPYMGLGRNMAYRKELFFGQRGFAPHLNLQSGADDLFISDVARKGNTRVEVSPESVMNVVTEEPLMHWKESRINQIYTSRFYRTSARFRNGAELLGRYLTYLALAAVVFLAVWNANGPLAVVAAVLFVFRTVLQLVAVHRSARCVGEKGFFFTVLLQDLFLPIRILLLRFDSMYHRRKSYTRPILH